MIKVKICGITNLEDASTASMLGADALGFVFVPESPRYIDPFDAGLIIQKLPPFIKTVGLFVNSTANFIEKAVNDSGIDIIQFHGDESEEFCSQFNKNYIKAFQVQETLNLIEYCDIYKSASAILLDTFSKNARGGTGQTFNWDLIPKDCVKPLIIAGGLDCTNIKLLLQKIHPYAVDVSGGVEKGKGKKDFNKMKEFILGVKNASL